MDSSFNYRWQHLAGTYDGSELKLYVDGELEASTPHIGSIAGNTLNVNIGRNSELTDRFYAGAVDDVRIYNRALRDEEVKLLAGHKGARVDLTDDSFVDFRDYAFLAEWWMEDCAYSNGFCDWTDFDLSGKVDAGDLSILTGDWLRDSPRPACMLLWSWDLQVSGRH